MKEFFIRRYRSEAGQGEGRRTLVRVDDRGAITYADSNAEAVLGVDAPHLVDHPIARILATRQDDPFASSQRHRFKSGEPVLITLRHKDGYFFTAEVTLRLEEKDSDQPASAQILLRDQPSLDPRLLQLVEATGELGIWELDLQTNQVSWTEGVYNLMELRSGADITPEQALFYCQTKQSRIRALFRRCISRGQPFTITFELLTTRQRTRRVQLTGRAIKSGNRIVKLGGTLVDLTREMEQEKAAHNARTLLSAIVGATPDLVAAVDTDLNLLCYNEAYSRHFQQAFGREPLEGQSLSTQLRDFPNERRLLERLWHRAFERDSFAVEMPLTSQQDNAQVYEVHYQKLNGADGELIGAVHVARDITERIRTSGSRNYLNTHDPITGLLNRRELIKRMGRLLDQPEHPASALLYIDLDHFAKFNDNFGNGTCDRYLRELASALGLKVRQRDALARLAGDTFVLLLENCSESEARKVSQNLLDLVQDFSFEWKGEVLNTTASAGLLVLEERLPEDPEQLLAQAADLCHTAKVAGRNRLHTASADSKALQESEARKLFIHIQNCLDKGELKLAYQALRPVASATWGDHIEILARFRGLNEGDEWLKPERFLPIAERFDLARRIDREVIRQTLAWLGEHKLLEPRLKYCGFNLSLASVLDDSFGDFLQELLAASNFSNDSFCMEISESHASQYPDEVAVLCDTLHDLGCQVALDGAGASVGSYTLASRLPVDIIKLDRSMMTQLHQDPVQQVMVEAMHKIAASAGKLTVATFIENDDTLRKARTLGLHFGQGYRLHKPQPLEALAPVQWDVPQAGA
ncbi:EAL domain-containing protein [Marinobacter zhejiangensis]|uniref:Diguanylate cyclase (GGDEF) domain-containing protein n=1 Tax=Marinobacter zhejiangensis TaxID=488535 RepID=A0A1I4MED0_9GAMM|nr:EAL domain-containing protein [Marinobacter zhejiangensis]SFM01376.1 diguanylate cyclase (GGDEF) domain-containing protein [Marinobacter zhejiangensis]